MCPLTITTVHHTYRSICERNYCFCINYFDTDTLFFGVFQL